MSTSSVISPLFHALIDDAALFPPGNAPMDVAVPAHREHRTAWYADMIGPLLCPASRLSELTGRLDTDDDELGVTVIIDTGTGGIGEAVDTVAADHRLVLRGVEVALRGDPLRETARHTVAALDAALGGPDDDEPAYVEVPRDGRRDALEILAESGYRAKLRTGGPTPDAFPPEDEVARFVVTCLDLDVPFKFTAGLHHAVRRTTPDGREEHGFCNALLAVAVALDGGDEEAIAQLLAERDAPGIAGRIGSLSTERASSVRAWLGSYGSCSVTEPIDDLRELELVTR